MKDITYIIDITAGQPERMHINRDTRTAYFFLSAFDTERMQEMKERADADILRGLLRAVEPPEGGNRMIEIKAPVSGWHEASREQAKKFVNDRMDSMQAIPKAERADYINRHLLKGITVRELQEGR